MTTPFVYIMFKIGMENKQYGINFEIVTSSYKLSCNSKTFFMPFLLNFYIYEQFKYMVHYIVK
jgi:hypothetical protein